MSVYHKFKDELDYLINSSNREIGDKMLAKELVMTEDFIVQLGNIIDAPTRHARDEIINRIIFDKHGRFAPELARVMEELDREPGDATVAQLLEDMKEYYETIKAIKAAPTREDGDAIIRKVLSEIEAK